ncbi:unnamed protein product [Protopolystoma xenopodis]|uniref:NADP-dependent oxidoreductase domain-containing protein n=1 Tax=Protopolystoma xenopodis TaxID=117903 RepID=A0A3S5CR77_9PLAT|nr:unnamed protein product [Protopolystoma xenopodis]
MVHKEMDECLGAVVKAGYRGIDTASMYSNEKKIGEFLKSHLKDYGLYRKDIFVTTKLHPCDHGSGKAPSAAYKSLGALQTPYIDLYLIHWPGLFSHDGSGAIADIRRQSWQALEQLVCEDVSMLDRSESSSHVIGSGNYRPLRYIGISNYTSKHIKELASYSTIRPFALQSEYHPYLGEQWMSEIRKTLADCFPISSSERIYDSSSHDLPESDTSVYFMAYSPLTSGHTDLLTCKTLLAISKEVGKSTAQVALRWSLQKGNCEFSFLLFSQVPLSPFNLRFQLGQLCKREHRIRPERLKYQKTCATVRHKGMNKALL